MKKKNVRPHLSKKYQYVTVVSIIQKETHASTSTWGEMTRAILETDSEEDTTRSPSDLSWSTKESTSLALLPNFMARLGPAGFMLGDLVSYSQKIQKSI